MRELSSQASATDASDSAPTEVPPIAAPQTACCANPAMVPMNGHQIRIRTGAITIIAAVRDVCATCWRVNFESGDAIGELDVCDRPRVSRLARHVHNARSAILAGTETNWQSAGFPNPYEFISLGRSARIQIDSLFTDYKALRRADGDETILARYRAMFGLAPAGANVRANTPIARPIWAGEKFVGHVFEEREGRDAVDDDHVLYSPLTTSTLADPDEVWFGRDANDNQKSYKFLRHYYVYDNDGEDYAFHMVLAYTSGLLRTSYRLGGGVTAFNGMRFGIPLHTAYTPGIIAPPPRAIAAVTRINGLL